ncbi:MAG TPA: DUF1501 domain-containing protein [Gemmataceae bacterium]
MSSLERLTRRTWLSRAALGLTGVSLSGWLGHLAAYAAGDPRRKRSCILLWMAGGPAQTDTFDLKPAHANGGPFKEIDTAAPGVKIGEHFPQLAKQMKRLAVLRSMQTKEGDHSRATAHLRTGYRPQGSIRFPSLGALVSHERADAEADLPGFVSVTPQGAFAQPSVAAGFLGPQHAPLVVGSRGGTLKVEDLETSAISAERSQERLELLREMEANFLTSRPGAGTASHVTAYDRAVRLGRESAARAFDLSEEKNALRDRYGRSLFGQGCLLARRLVERGVPFVEVTLGGWDTHDNNFEQVKSRYGVLDPAWATLIEDLNDRSLLDSTLVVWMGEFGRTPGINPRNGRDHYPAAWSVVLGGGGIKGGQTVGRTSKDGLAVEDRPVSVPDLMATICLALGLDPKKQNQSNVSRPIRLADPSAEPVKEVLA